MTAKPKLYRDPWPDPPPSPPIDGIELSPMRLDQLDEILTIERESFPTPWTRQAFEYDLRRNDLASYWTVLWRGEVIGYSGFWLVDQIAHLTTICIRKDFRGLGLGKWLLLVTMQKGAEKGAKRFTLEVRESNLVARTLYESVGFHVAGRRENYYREEGEDALIMWTGAPPYEG